MTPEAKQQADCHDDSTPVSKHIRAAASGAGAGLMTATVLSVALPALAVPAVALSGVSAVGSLIAGVGALIWAEKSRN